MNDKNDKNKVVTVDSMVQLLEAAFSLIKERGLNLEVKGNEIIISDGIKSKSVKIQGGESSGERPQGTEKGSYGCKEDTKK